MNQPAKRIDPGARSLAQEFVSHLGSQIGPYSLQKLIGVGGMGAVFLAIHERLQKRVALKLLREEHKNKEGVAHRFFEEAKAAAGTGHENIIQVFDVGEDARLGPYLVMEHLEGAQGLGELLRREGPLSLERVAWIALQAARALYATHTRGMVHCDLKPSNILLTEALGQKDVVKIIDFGVAKAIPPPGDDVAITKTVRGTPKYMSPEQVVGRALDGRSDEYALGILVYQMICGFPPFSASAPAVVMKQQYKEPPPPLRASRPDLPAEAEAVILRALEKRPEARYPTILEFGKALSLALQSGAPAPSLFVHRTKESGAHDEQTPSSPFSPMAPSSPGGVERPFLLGDERGEDPWPRGAGAATGRLTPYQTEELFAPRPLGGKTPPLPFASSPAFGVPAPPGQSDPGAASTDTLEPVTEKTQGFPPLLPRAPGPLSSEASEASISPRASGPIFPEELAASIAPGPGAKNTRAFSEAPLAPFGPKAPKEGARSPRVGAAQRAPARRGPLWGGLALLLVGGLLGLWAYLSGYLGGGFSRSNILSAQAATASVPSVAPPLAPVGKEPGPKPSSLPRAPAAP